MIFLWRSCFPDGRALTQARFTTDKRLFFTEDPNVFLRVLAIFAVVASLVPEKGSFMIRILFLESECLMPATCRMFTMAVLFILMKDSGSMLSLQNP